VVFKLFGKTFGKESNPRNDDAKTKVVKPAVAKALPKRKKPPAISRKVSNPTKQRTAKTKLAKSKLAKIKARARVRKPLRPQRRTVESKVSARELDTQVERTLPTPEMVKAEASIEPQAATEPEVEVEKWEEEDDDTLEKLAESSDDTEIEEETSDDF
jgi:hypothetical protein